MLNLFNYVLEISIISSLIAQILKFFIDFFLQKKANYSILISTGGMPSSHTAFVVTLVYSIALLYSVHSIEFAISATFAAIVIHDAMGVRYQVGKQAEVLNEVKKNLETLLKTKNKLKEVKELLGHKPIEVLGGIIIGVLTAIIGYNYFYII